MYWCDKRIIACAQLQPSKQEQKKTHDWNERMNKTAFEISLWQTQSSWDHGLYSYSKYIGAPCDTGYKKLLEKTAWIFLIKNHRPSWCGSLPLALQKTILEKQNCFQFGRNFVNRIHENGKEWRQSPANKYNKRIKMFSEDFFVGGDIK